MKTLNLLLPCAIAMAAFSCGDINPAISKTAPKDFVWRATDCTDNTEGILLCPYNYLRLFENGTFTGSALRGYVGGTWTRDTATRQIWLRPISAGTASEEAMFTVFQVLDTTALDMRVQVLRDENMEAPAEERLVMNLLKTAVDFSRDPFRPDHQLWRKKPEKEETPAQLQARVLQYLSFLRMFYQFAADNNLERPDTDWFPKPLKMESPGSITMAYSNELKDWNACFFNEAQATKAYQIISGPFMQVKLKGNPDLNARNVDVITELMDKIAATN